MIVPLGRPKTSAQWRMSRQLIPRPDSIAAIVLSAYYQNVNFEVLGLVTGGDTKVRMANGKELNVERQVKEKHEKSIGNSSSSCPM